MSTVLGSMLSLPEEGMSLLWFEVVLIPMSAFTIKFRSCVQHGAWVGSGDYQLLAET